MIKFNARGLGTQLFSAASPNQVIKINAYSWIGVWRVAARPDTARHQVDRTNMLVAPVLFFLSAARAGAVGVGRSYFSLLFSIFLLVYSESSPRETGRRRWGPDISVCAKGRGARRRSAGERRAGRLMDEAVIEACAARSAATKNKARIMSHVSL
jgi:hypothetical protein